MSAIISLLILAVLTLIFGLFIKKTLHNYGD